MCTRRDCVHAFLPTWVKLSFSSYFCLYFQHSCLTKLNFKIRFSWDHTILLYFSVIISFWSSLYLNCYPGLGHRECLKWLIWTEALFVRHVTSNPTPPNTLQHLIKLKKWKPNQNPGLTRNRTFPTHFYNLNHEPKPFAEHTQKCAFCGSGASVLFMTSTTNFNGSTSF